MRSAFSSSPSASKYLVVGGYGLLNARVGFRWTDGWTIQVWSRNLLDAEYFEFLNAQGGRIIAAAARSGEGPACAALLRKIKECAAYAMKHGLGYLEGSGILPEVEVAAAETAVR